MAGTKKKRGRPYGANYCRGIRVRFPPEVDSALRRARRLYGVSISEMVRAGVMFVLAGSVPDAVAVIEHPKTGDSRKLRLIEYLRACTKAYIAVNEPEKAELLRQARSRGSSLPGGLRDTSAVGRDRGRRSATRLRKSDSRSWDWPSEQRRCSAKIEQAMGGD